MSTEAIPADLNPHAKRSWPIRAITLLLVVFVVYPLSLFPTALAMMWLAEYGVMSEKTAQRILETTYHPVISIVERAPLLESALEAVGNQFERLAP